MQRSGADAELFVLNESGVHKRLAGKRYFITKRFSDQPQRMLKELLDKTDNGE